VTEPDAPPAEPEESPDGHVAAEPDAAEPDAAATAVATPEAPAEAAHVDLSSLEALLFSTHHPLTAARLAELLEVKSVKPVRDAVRELNRQYAEQSRSFHIEQVAGGYQMLTLPVFAEIIKRHQQKEADAKLTRASIETLAIIAYKQPILRVNVEAIRGVACGETIRGLMEKHLVKIAGRAEEPGRPILYGTTKRFLEVFGLNSLKDLPEQEDALAAKAKQVREAKARAAAEAPESVGLTATDHAVDEPTATPEADEAVRPDPEPNA
jgi:segregation and condensation protein B